MTLNLPLFLFYTLSFHWPQLTGGSASPLGILERRSGVSFMEFINHSVVLPLIWSACISMLCLLADGVTRLMQSFKTGLKGLPEEGRTGCVSPCHLQLVNTCKASDAYIVANCINIATIGVLKFYLCALQGSGQPISVANHMAMFARERLCLWWRLLRSHTTSDNVQKSGFTLDTRCRCLHRQTLYSCKKHYLISNIK